MGQNRKAWFRDILQKYDRIAVCGSPKSGKTTLVRGVRGHAVIHTDSFMHDSWESVPHSVIAEVAKMSDPKFIVEGVQAPRTLRKGLKVDAVLWLPGSLAELSPRQQGMAKGTRTVLDDWHATHREVPILVAPPIAADDENE